MGHLIGPEGLSGFVVSSDLSTKFEILEETLGLEASNTGNHCNNIQSQVWKLERWERGQDGERRGGNKGDGGKGGCVI